MAHVWNSSMKTSMCKSFYAQEKWFSIVNCGHTWDFLSSHRNIHMCTWFKNHSSKLTRRDSELLCLFKANAWTAWTIPSWSYVEKCFSWSQTPQTLNVNELPRQWNLGGWSEQRRMKAIIKFLVRTILIFPILSKGHTEADSKKLFCCAEENLPKYW